MRILLTFSALIFSLCISAQYVVSPAIDIDVKSPAGVHYDKASKQFTVVSKGSVMVLDEKGKTLNTIPIQGAYDLKAITKVGNQFYVVDEMLRKVFVLKALDFSIKNVHNVSYDGPTDRGFESIFFNPIRESITLITEKSPTVIIELDFEMKLMNKEVMKGFKEVSDAQYFMNFVWVLSDELHTLYKLDPNTYKLIQSWDVPILNPEGISIMNEEKMEMVIVSNKGRKLHFISFKKQEETNKIF